MPTFHTTERRTSVSGGSSVSTASGDTGTTVDFRGRIKFNGHPLLSPKQLLHHWAAMQAIYQDEAVYYGDKEKGDDQVKSEQATGRAAAYTTAILALTSTTTPSNAVLALEAALELIARDIPAPGHARGKATVTRGERLLEDLRRTAAVTWVDDD